ncbi:MAG: uridine kinase [Culicoidibacterales bacterium]
MKNEQVKPVIIGIAGGSASGKTTVADKIIENFGHTSSVTLIRHDDYYNNQGHLTMEERVLTNYDHPLSLDNALLAHDLSELLAGKTIAKPVYDFKHHTRALETEITKPTQIIILEGILVLEDERLRDLMDIKIFVDTDADIRFIRRVKRDIAERGRTFESVVEQYLGTVRPMHNQFVEPSKRFADIILPEGGSNFVAIDLISTKIQSILDKK